MNYLNVKHNFVEEMEMKFSTMFKPMVRIPSPPIFQRVDKIYNSRLVGKDKLTIH